MNTPDASTLFKKHFGETAVHIVRAPGRLEVLGNHTDYNDGLVLSVAVDKYIQIASSPRTDGKIKLISSAFPEPEIFWADKLEKNPASPWTDYVKGTLQQLRRAGIAFGGFNAAVHGTIPLGAGMSSSAALEVATALTVRQLHPFSLGESGLTIAPARDQKGYLPPLTRKDKLAIAKICRAAEQEFVGVNVGLLDQISSLFGKAAHVMEIDFQSLAVELSPLPGEAIIVCNSGAKHALTDGAYNELREQCEGAARVLGAKSLRSVEPKVLEANKDKLTLRQYQCAHHIVSEIKRVIAASRALQQDDHAQFGQYMFQSHESSRDFLKNSVPELDLLVELARTMPGCLGARLTGGGFGGATINLVAHHQAEEFMNQISATYEKQTGRKMTPMLCQMVDGAA